VTRRSPYADVGAAMRDTIARANGVRPRLRASERSVLDAVFNLTASWSLLSVRVYAANVAEAAGVNEKTARLALNRLAEEAVIVWSPVRGLRAPTTLAIFRSGSTPHLAKNSREKYSLFGPRSPDETGPLSPDETGPLSPGVPDQTGPLSPGLERMYVIDGDKVAIWLSRFGVEYAHDRVDFGEECCKALGVSADEAEALRLELLERGEAA
jgi:hypothetical protein